MCTQEIKRENEMEANESDEKKNKDEGEAGTVIDIDAEESNASLTHEHDSKETKNVEACSPENNTKNAENVNEADISAEKDAQNEEKLAENAVADGENIEKCQTLDIIDNESGTERCDDVEPMDIDEILNSFNTDEDASNNDEFCVPQPTENNEPALLEQNDSPKMDVKQPENIENGKLI